MRKTHQRSTKKTLHKGPSLWYALPALLLFGLFAAIPLVGVVILSLTNWDGLGAVTWNGIGNWIRMLHDPLVLNGLKLTVILTVVSWLVQTPICILLGSSWQESSGTGPSCQCSTSFRSSSRPLRSP